MNNALVFLLLFCLSLPSWATGKTAIGNPPKTSYFGKKPTLVKPYMKKDGKQVKAHSRIKRNDTSAWSNRKTRSVKSKRLP